ncbi:hypothetical protein J4207_04635 [Candidatus Woesearchaeota archaeon]|nr:hypothetical protein [Candidatus Woesearchaeota archaeon]
MPKVLRKVTLSRDVRMKLHTCKVAFKKHDFLSENFGNTLRELRSFSMGERLKRLGIV